MVTRNFIVVVLGFLIPVMCCAQVSDDFSDGDFTTNPPWDGDISKFTVTSGRLKLQAPPATGTAFLSTASLAVHYASWEFYVQLDFNPSSSNYAKVYLTASQSNMTGPLNGYFVRVGHTSREVSLFRQTGAVETKIIDGLDDRINQPTVKAKIRVTRGPDGTWQLYTDVGVTGSYLSEGIAMDLTHTTSSHLGFVCIYSSTRSDKFWFDDVVVTGTVVPDTTPPVVSGTSVMDSRNIRVAFSEPVSEESATRVSNFLINGLGPPSSAMLLADRQTVSLALANPLVNGVTYTLQVAGLEDLAGNRMEPAAVKILFFQPLPTRNKDIIFSELFPDPTPQLGLPAAEFVEIHNRSNGPLDIGGWIISDGSSKGIFPSQIVLPGEYWIITASSAAGLFVNLGKTIGLTNFPTLNNAGDVITLRDNLGRTIDSVNYTLDWYRDADKAQGGWTLELIDPGNPCGEQDNWAASEDSRGGTPGRPNSILANKPDLSPPILLYALPEDQTRILIVFNEKLKPSSVSGKSFQFTPPGGDFITAFKDISLRVVMVTFSTALVPKTLYKVVVRGIQDCSGNELVLASTSFGLPEKAETRDIVINEVLFNPRSGGVDFVEFFNRSSKFISLKNWKVSKYDAGVSDPITLSQAQSRLIPPGDYFVLTPDPVLVKLHYPQSEEKAFLKATLPSLPDNAGSVAILDEQGTVIDRLAYSKNWHSVFLKSDEGVSLERISTEGVTLDPGNWTSASSLAGYATPGFVNSQRRQVPGQEGEVVVVPEIFVPARGTHDFIQIQYRFDQPGQVANVMVLNQLGKIVRTLSTNDVVGTEGFFRWDGEQEDGSRALAGYYVVWFELFRGDGAVTTFRKRVVVAWP
ncbi:MAG: lamin tail domain-containing protein [Cytophagales bacterium]|nr:lamin tail domain-containing protein [Cytophagales bacterium]